MCLLIAIHRVLPEWPLVVAANRDEWLARPAVPMTTLQSDAPRIIGGRDLQAGGTWAAINQHGVVAALTNNPLATPQHVGGPAKKSRGKLPILLAQAESAELATAQLSATIDPSEYNPCWLLVADRQTLHYCALSGQRLETQRLPSGIYVLENRPLDQSAKAKRVRDAVTEVLHPEISLDQLFDQLKAILADHRRPNSTQTAKSSASLVDRLSAVCVHEDGYGTRSSLLVALPAELGAETPIRYADGPPCRSTWQSAEAF
ncbi:MAG: NRDE family protein [Deltaproteobacteria bacterium]|nr:NRDE family protein [Deltaproteobacteria bacterium]